MTQGTKHQTRLDVRRFLDDQSFGRYHLLIVAICASIVFMDGFDAQAMGYVAPALTAALGIPRAALGTVISSGLFGMMIGALLFGPLADRFGRKPILLVCTAIFGVGALLTATATTIQQLMIFRIFTGFGLGGAMPNTIALTSEYMPRKSRATSVMVMFTGFSIGAAVGGFVAAGLIARFGWQSIFVVGGVLPIVIGIIAIGILPESIRFLVLKGGQDEKVKHYLRRVAPAARIESNATYDVGEDHHGGTSPVKQLFMEKRGVITLLVWLMFFMNLLNLYFLNSWLPTVMNDVGIPVQTAILITTLFQIGGAVGAVLLGRILDRHLSFGVLAATYLSAGVFILLIGQAGASVPLLALVIFLAGFCVVGGQTSSNALTAEYYPTTIRATGVGWALGIGRVGSIVGPILGGALLAGGTPVRTVFWAAAIPPVIATVAAFCVATIRKRELVR
jgi:MFS transporter, AAHS family, 4-hydroxybenzoate transporter